MWKCRCHQTDVKGTHLVDSMESQNYYSRKGNFLEVETPYKYFIRRYMRATPDLYCHGKSMTRRLDNLDEKQHGVHSDYAVRVKKEFWD